MAEQKKSLNSTNDKETYGDPAADFLESPRSSPTSRLQTLSQQLEEINEGSEGKLKRQSSRSRSPLRFMQPRKADFFSESDDEPRLQQLLLQHPAQLLKPPSILATKKDLHLTAVKGNKPVNATDIAELKSDNDMIKQMMARLLEHEEILFAKMEELQVGIERNEGVAKETKKDIRSMFDVAEAADAKAEELRAEIKVVEALAEGIQQGVTGVKSAVDIVNVGINDVKEGVNEVKEGVNEVKEGVAEVKQEVIEGRAENNVHFEAARVQLENFRGEALEQFNLLRIDINRGANRFKMECLPIKTTTRDEFFNTLIQCFLLFWYYIGLVIYHVVSYYNVMKKKLVKFLAKITSIMLLFVGGAGLVIPVGNLELLLHIFFHMCEVAMFLFIGKLIGPLFGYKLEDEMGIQLLLYLINRVSETFWLFIDFLQFFMKNVPPFNYFYKLFDQFGVFTAIQYVKDIFNGLLNLILYFSKPQEGRSWYEWGMGAKGGSIRTPRTPRKVVPLRHKLFNYPRLDRYRNATKSKYESQFHVDTIDINKVFAYKIVSKAQSFFQRIQSDSIEREKFFAHITKIGLKPDQIGTIVKARIEIAFTFFDGVINGKSIKDIMPSRKLLMLAQDPRERNIPMKTILENYNMSDNMTDKIKLLSSHSSMMKRKTRRYKIKNTLKQKKNKFNSSKRFR